MRPLAALSAVAVSMLVLSACSAQGDDAATPAPSGSVADLCAAAAAPGAVSDGIAVTGEIGAVPEVTFDTPVDTDGLELQRTVLTEGGGQQLQPGDYLDFAYTLYDGSTGEVIEQYGYEPGDLLPQQVSAEGGGALFGCAPIGSRIVAAGVTGKEETPSVVYVIDLLGINPTAAWGTSQDPVAGMPTVTVAEDGTPSIVVPETDPPTETRVAVLKEADGYQVESGDQVLIQFRGARWSTGELFEGGDTWDGGTPYAAATTGFVAGFQKGLVGHTVGSQVLVVMTPADGYGEGTINETDLVGETLVFVIDILGAQRAATQ